MALLVSSILWRTLDANDSFWLYVLMRSWMEKFPSLSGAWEMTRYRRDAEEQIEDLALGFGPGLVEPADLGPHTRDDGFVHRGLLSNVNVAAVGRDEPTASGLRHRRHGSGS